MTSIRSLFFKISRIALASGLAFMIALPAWADDTMTEESPDAKKMNARERFYKKYKNKLPSTKKEMEQQRLEMKKRREERLKQHLENRKMRKEKRNAKKAVTKEGKPAEAAKKKQERIEVRKKEMMDRAKSRKETIEKENRKMREAVREKARQHREEMKKQRGTGDVPKAVDKEGMDGDRLNREAVDAIRKKDAMKRREEILEKRRLRREQRKKEREMRRATGRRDDVDRVVPEKPEEPTIFDQGDGPPDFHISGSDSKSRPAVAPKKMNPDQHISGSGSPGAIDQPHVSGTP